VDGEALKDEGLTFSDTGKNIKPKRTTTMTKVTKRVLPISPL